MKLLSDMNRLDTLLLEEAIKDYPLLSQEGKGKEATCIAIFSLGSARWFILEGEREGSDILLWGIAVGVDDEDPYYGHFHLSELESLRLDCSDINLGILKTRQQQRFRKAQIKKFSDSRLTKFLDSFPD